MYSIALPIFSLLLASVHVGTAKSRPQPSPKTQASLPKKTKDGFYVVEWAELRGLDLKTGKKSPLLDLVKNKNVRMSGFMVPLEDNLKNVTEFLLVPSPQACIHVPPPPANQIVYIKMSRDQKTSVSFVPLTVEGKLRIMNTDSPYGKVSYWMTGEKVKDYMPTLVEESTK